VLLRNLAGPIDFVCVHIFAQVFFETCQEFFARFPIFRALLRPWINPIKIVTTDEQIAGEAAPLIQWITRRFGKLERFALAFRHLRRVDHGCGHRLLWLATGRVRVAAATGLGAGFLGPGSAGVFRRFGRGLPSAGMFMSWGACVMNILSCDMCYTVACTL